MLQPRRRKSRFRRARRPDLTVPQVLGWCDAFHASMTRWPTRWDGTRSLRDTTWAAIDGTLQKWWRGLPGGSTLAKLLHTLRGSAIRTSCRH